MEHFHGVFGFKTGLSELLNGSLGISVAVGLRLIGYLAHRSSYQKTHFWPHG